MQSLQEETGIDPGWINNGGLFIASSRERLEEYKRLMTVSVSCQLMYSSMIKLSLTILFCILIIECVDIGWI